MALVGRRDGRNFGYGRQLSYAGPQALRDMFGGGHYGTVKAHSDRWQAFVRWCRSKDGPGFNDARQIDRQTLLDYAGHLRQQFEQGELAIATAQNRLSSVNRTLAALRGDQYVKVPSPSNALEMQRTTIRMTVPQGQDREHVIRIFDRWQRDNPWTWRRKHLVWFLNQHMSQCTRSTRYYYLLTLRLLIIRLGKAWHFEVRDEGHYP
ncbi:hypothetical protein FBY04_10185 [Pseudomonas sp. SJZ080]|nr:hypothetical protein FBY04_10185 [Pseudomonas sp. SJZ080]